ncbi:MAG: AAA family ATPase, partial [Deltaproteobacteria bacterium]|nr:AAA family ATPase [Deltaproteobacteria bacterium]
MVKELSYERVRAVCTYDFSSCTSTAELTPLKEIIGQDRAVKALKFGLDIDEKGFNIYVAGAPGTGRKSAIVSFLEEMGKNKPVPPDWCYVNNFDDPNSPNAIQMPAGMGSEFVKDMDSFTTEMKGALKLAFESEDYQRKRTQTLKNIEDEREIITTQVNTLAGNAGFLLQRTPIGLMLIPIVNGKPVNDQEFTQLPPQLQGEITARREKLQSELRSPMRQFRDIEQKMAEAIKQLNRDIAIFALEPMLTVLNE